CLVYFAIGCATAIAAPSYDLPVGREYHFTVDCTIPGASRDSTKTIAWVLAENADHSRRVLGIENLTLRFGTNTSFFSGGAMLDVGGQEARIVSQFGEIEPAIYFPHLPDEPKKAFDATFDTPPDVATTLHKTASYQIDLATGLLRSARIE